MITAAEVTLTYLDVGPLFLPALLIMMVAKFLIVVSFFMHLKFDNKLFSFLFYLGLLPGRLRLRRRPGDVPLLRQLIRSSSCARVRDAGACRHTYSAGSTTRRGQTEGVTDPFRFQAHLDVWLLVAVLTGAYVYMVRVVGPHAVAAGQQVVTRRNVAAFVAAMVMLWLASDWPIHDIGEQYLYSVHMLQHMMLSYFLPPLALLATPEWLLRVLVGDGRLYAVAALAVQAGRRRRAVQPRRDGHPHPRRRQRVGHVATARSLHYALHVMVVVTASADVDAGLRSVPRAAHGHRRAR